MPTIMSSLPKWIWIPFSFSSLFLSDGQNYIRDYKRKFYELFTSSFSMIRNDTKLILIDREYIDSFKYIYIDKCDISNFLFRYNQALKTVD